MNGIRTTEPLHFCLRLLGIPPSTYYYQIAHPPRSLQDKYRGLRRIVEAIIIKHPGYGYRRIRQALKKRQIIINPKPLRKLLNIWHLKRRRPRIHPTPSPIAKHLQKLGAKANLARRITNPHPFQVIFTDFTELHCAAGTFHFIPFSDKMTRRIMGWHVSNHADTANALGAYRMTRRYLKRMAAALSRIIIHQDQDSVFTGYEYLGALLNDGITPSFTENGCRDNPAMESCIGHFKEDYGDILADCRTFKELKQTLSRCVRDWNRNRIHSSLKGRSPDEFIHTYYKLKKN